MIRCSRSFGGTVERVFSIRIVVVVAVAVVVDLV